MSKIPEPMILEPINQETLEIMYKLFGNTTAGERERAFALARYAESVAITKTQRILGVLEAGHAQDEVAVQLKRMADLLEAACTARTLGV